MKRINPSLAEPMRIGQHLLQIGLSLLVLGFSPQLAASETKAPADQTRAQQPHAGSLSHWDLSAVIDVGANSKSIELGARPKGSHLGHSDITVKGEIGEHLSLVGTVGAHSEGNDRSAIEHHVEALLRGRTRGCSSRSSAATCQKCTRLSDLGQVSVP